MSKWYTERNILFYITMLVQDWLLFLLLGVGQGLARLALRKMSETSETSALLVKYQIEL